MAEFRMPSLGATMDFGTVSHWKVRPGDHVEQGEIVAVVDTDKAALEVEIFQGGIIDEILVPEGEKVPVGTVLATVRGEGEPAPAAATARAPGRRLRISPAARRRARELGVDVTALQGSGPGGALTLADVEAAASSAAPKKGEQRRAQVMRALGAAMAHSKREIPHYYLHSAIDVSHAREWLDTQNAGRPPAERTLFAALLYKAVALSLRKVPVLNGYFRDGTFVPSDAIHLGIAISLRHGGTVAPALHNADALALGELMAALSDLTRRTRAGTLRGSEMSDATVTVTSLGDTGPDTVVGVIYPPQVALIGFGAVRQRPWVVDGQVAPRHVITASLSADHRASEGRQGARFLEVLSDQLGRPEEL